MPACPPDAIRRHFRSARPSEYIDRLGEVHEADPRPVVLLLRVSTPEQESAGNLTDQDTDVRRKLAAAGIRESEVVAVVRGVESSRIHAGRPLLELAIGIARECGGRVVADSRDRFIRHVDSNNRVVEQAPTHADFKLLHWFAHGIPLATIEDPDGPARSKQIIRGQTAKGHTGGRPRKVRAKERRQDRIELARQLRNEGLSYRKISDRLNEQADGHAAVTHNTIKNWLNRPCAIFPEADAVECGPSPENAEVFKPQQPPPASDETITVYPTSGTLSEPPLPDPIVDVRNPEPHSEQVRINEADLATTSSTGRLARSHLLTLSDTG